MDGDGIAFDTEVKAIAMKIKDIWLDLFQVVSRGNLCIAGPVATAIKLAIFAAQRRILRHEVRITSRPCYSIQSKIEMYSAVG